MAERRMFSKRISKSARFLKMPQTAQNLYFHLGMEADDDGVVEVYQVMKAVSSNEDDLKVLVSKEFVKVLNEDLVAFILDWRENNLIRSDRKINSIYKDLLLRMLPDVELVEPKPRADTGVPPRQLPTGRPLDGIGEERIGKVKEEEETTNSSFKKKTKRYFQSREMRFAQGRWWVIPKNGGQWLEFVGSLKDTVKR